MYPHYNAVWLKRLMLSVIITFTFSGALQAASNTYNALSPDGKVDVTLVCADSRLTYSLSWNGRRLFNNSALSLFPNASYTVMDSETNSIDKTWETVWGQFSSVHDYCRQITLKLNASGTRVDLICRVYNDGVGIRCVVPHQQKIAHNSVHFISEYNTAEQCVGWFPNHESEPIGPVPFGKGNGRRMPAVIDAGKGVFLGLLESDLYTAKGFETATISRNRSESTAKLTPQGLITPWRVVLLGKQPGALLTSTVPLNLAAECKLKDTSWIKPGKGVWDWRVHGYVSGDFTYGVNTESYLRYIDFASKNNIPLMELAGIWWHFPGGKFEAKPEVDMTRIMQHAKEKNVGIMLYYDNKCGGRIELEKMCRLFSEMGAAGVKYGFMGNDASFTRRAIEMCAKYQLSIYFHDGPCPMTGVSRTLPNALSREFCHAQQDCRRAFSPQAFLKMAMINALSGPLDQNNGAYGLNGINRGERKYGPRKNESFNSTVVSETARVFVIFSGCDVLPDAPEEYEKKADLFEFIRQMPATWDETRVINSRIGEHITTARRSGDQWFVGSVINEKGGSVKIPLGFLEAGKTYDVTFYEDAPETHYIRDRESYRVRKGKVTREDTIEAQMAAGGGHCMWIRHANKDASATTQSPGKLPNIVYILADDMGYGDGSALNPKSKIKTPNIDRLANEGMRFTDAHSGSAVCTPTRYGILTGRYCWRTRLKKGVLWGYSKHLIEPERMTVASLLKQSGYNTACIGKWHLGMDMPTTDGKQAGANNIDWKGKIKNGPIANGFDYFYGISASLDMHPYIYIENDKFVGECTTQKAFQRKGPAHKEFEAVDVLPEISRKTVQYIHQQNTDKPFFVYVPLTSPHTPIVPSKEYRGKSSLGQYGDFCIQTDAVVGEICAALEENGLAEDTIVIFTSDNGCAPYIGVNRLEQMGHYPSYVYRGYKADIFEGGHRIPYLVRWPGKVTASSRSDETICLTDLMATCAAIVGKSLPGNVSEDSCSILPAMLGQKLTSPIREATVHHSVNGSFSIRRGKWKLVLCPDSGGWSDPKPGKAKGLPPVQLYDLSNDIGETGNVQNKHPEIVKELTELLETYKRDGHSVQRQ